MLLRAVGVLIIVCVVAWVSYKEITSRNQTYSQGVALCKVAGALVAKLPDSARTRISAVPRLHTRPS